MHNKKITSIFLFLIVTFSLIGIIPTNSLLPAYGSLNNSQNNFANDYINLQNSPKSSQSVSVDLSENIGLKSNNEKQFDELQHQPINYVVRSQKQISLSENLTMKTISADQYLVFVVKQNEERITIMERITNNDKIR